MRRTVDIVLWLALPLWLALALVGGFAAMAVFPAARELPISMQGYEAFLSAEPLLGRQLVAGHLVERIFEAATAPRLAVAALAALALLLQIGASQRATLVKSRLAALALSAGALLLSAMHALPEFRAADESYRSLAGQEQTIPAALEMKPEVDAAHEFASRVATTEVLAVLALIALSAAASGATRRA